LIILLLLSRLVLTLGHAVPAPPPVPDSGTAAYDVVDPFLGTGGDGHTFPGATVPFGMVQPSPDTRIVDFHRSYGWAAGYRYDDTTIQGFSQTHFSGTGHSDLGDFELMPIAGDVKLDPGPPDNPDAGYRSRFSHELEEARPGYYAVTLSDYGIRVELTATRRVAVHRYTFPEGTPTHVLVDLRSSIYDYPGKVAWSSVRVRADGTVTGCRLTRGWAPGRELCFALRFSRPLTGHALYDREGDVAYRGFAPPAHDDPARRAEIQGRALVGVFDFGEMATPLVATISISPVSEDAAVANLDADKAVADFDAVRAAARREWERALAAFDVDAPAHMRTRFFTALYHTLIAPNLDMDADGGYRGPDGGVHTAEGFTFYSTYSLWDTYRAEHPLLTLIQPPGRTEDFVRSFLAFRKESPYGILPIWSFQGLETWCMIGYHAVPVIADAYLKGIRGFSAEEALDAMVASATYGPWGGLDAYMTLGYVPIDQEPEAASKTLEYAFDDWTIGRMAQEMGRTQVAERFLGRAKSWSNVFDPKTGFVRARMADGAFREPFDPAAAGYNSDYTEGNAWQYSWYEPQDIGGLMRALGGDEALVAKLDSVFDTKVDPKEFANVEDISGLIGYYAQGNEPSHHIAYLYDYAGRPWMTQKRLTQIVTTQYGTGPEGLSGNDDVGQMSAWLVFTSLGFYPVAPASNQYVIGRPFVRRAELHLPNGNTFTVVADGLDDAHPWVGGVTLDGKPLTRTYVTHAEIEGGGELRFTMRSQPDKRWATGLDGRPYSLTPYPRQR
jgi:predicted alpha-1,2-mannosidase